MDKCPLPLASTAHRYDRFIAALNLLPRSLLSPAAPRRQPVSVASPPVMFPPFFSIDVSSVPVNPRGFVLLGSVLPLLFLKTLLPPSVLDLRPVPCRFQEDSYLYFLAS